MSSDDVLALAAIVFGASVASIATVSLERAPIGSDAPPAQETPVWPELDPYTQHRMWDGSVVDFAIIRDIDNMMVGPEDEQSGWNPPADPIGPSRPGN